MTDLSGVADYYERLGGYVTTKYKHLKKGLQQEIAETLTGLVLYFLAPELLKYIQGTYHLKDGTTVQGQSAFDRLVKEDKDFPDLIERYRPSLLGKIEKARKYREYIEWDDVEFSAYVSDYLEEHGIRVDASGRAYVERTVERFRRKIYD